MRSRRFALFLVCIALLTSAVAPARGEHVILNDVPAYDWTRGCSPTAGMMIMGYWDAYGYSALIPGSNSWSSNKSAIQNAIASPQHVADYALYNGVNDEDYSSPYTDKSELGGAHGNNCLADSMRTSFSSEGLTYSSTSTSRIGPGMEDYASWRGYIFTSGGNHSSPPTWTEFKNEIQYGRPVVFSVDTDRDGQTDHSVTAIGYRDSNGYPEYACNDTWETKIRWERFRPVSSSYNWGVDGWHTLRVSGTSDTCSQVSSSQWSNPSSWDNGVPDDNTFVCIPEGSTITVSSPARAFMVNTTTYGAILEIQDNLNVTVLRAGGIVTQTAGTVSIATTLGGEGSYELLGGHLNVGDAIRAGFIYAGGTVCAPKVETSSIFRIKKDLTIGDPQGIQVFKAVNWGQMLVQDGATVTQVGDSVEIPRRLGISKGTYRIPEGATLAVGNIDMGSYMEGPAYLMVSGGSVNVIMGLGPGYVYNTGHISLGDESGSTGTLDLSAGTVSIDGQLHIGGSGLEGGTGIVQQTGGTLSCNGIELKGYEGENATYELVDGEVLTGWIRVGRYEDQCSGYFLQTGGKMTLLGGGGYNDCINDTYELRGGEYSGGGTIGYYGPALFRQSGGVRNGSVRIRKGTYEMSGGSLECTDTGEPIWIGNYGTSYPAYGEFKQSGGTINGRLVKIDRGLWDQIGGETTIEKIQIAWNFSSEGQWNLSGGRVTAVEVFVGAPDGYGSCVGTMNVGNAELSVGRFLVADIYGSSESYFNITDQNAQIMVSEYLRFGKKAGFSAVPGAAIHMTGSAFENWSTNPDNMVGLGNLTMIFAGGSEDIDPFEVAGEDMGAVFAGLESNFALGTLQLGGADIGQIQLVDDYDNRPDWTGSEALYVENLILGAGSTLDLNGLNLYYLNFTDLGGTIDFNGGDMQQVPEPTAMLLLALGACLPLLRKRRYLPTCR